MARNKLVYLSYLLDGNTPTYGNRNRFVREERSSIAKGDVANDSSIETTVHIGTHIDMPYHFFADGQTVESYDASFFDFSDVLFIEIEPRSLIIRDELLEKLEAIEDKAKYDMLIVKTGICDRRDEAVFWESNYGFDPLVAPYLREKFHNIRVLGFDSVSVSSFAHRLIGREAHKAFLDPAAPILLLEDMDLRAINDTRKLHRVTVAPMRIAQCDGLPCTVIGEIE